MEYAKRNEIMLSILDTDLYKFSCSYAYMKLFPQSIGTFEFTDRSGHVWTDDEFNRFCENLKVIESLTMTNQQYDWVVKNLGYYIDESYWEWLKQFRFSLDKVKCFLDDDRHLKCKATDNMHKVTLYEIPILGVASYTHGQYADYDIEKSMELLKNKITLANVRNIVFSEFGTRRRISAEMQDHCIDTISKFSNTCVGTSNVHFACKYNLKAIGTYPHEWPMFHAAITGGYIDANNRAMENWVKVYDGYLGTALIDAFTTPVFLQNFSKKLACLFDGVRQDSGDEYQIGEMIIEKYKQLNIDPMKKFIVFSNGLNFNKAEDIKIHFEGKIGVSFGIGTNITNDPVFSTETDYKAPNYVMKLMSCRLNDRHPWHPCIKISDDKGKEMGNPNDIKMAKYQLGIIDSID